MELPCLIMVDCYDLSQFLKRPVDVISLGGLKKDSEFERSVKEEMVLL